jgi:hypothetical protein
MFFAAEIVTVLGIQWVSIRNIDFRNKFNVFLMVFQIEFSNTGETPVISALERLRQEITNSRPVWDPQ